MNILICWTGLTGYTGSNWRALQRLPGVKLKVYVEPTAMDQGFTAERELGGLDYRVLSPGRKPGGDFAAELEAEVAAFRPDAMLIVGWRAKSCRWFATHRAWRQVPKILVCDLAFAWSLRKILARFVLAGYLRRFAAAFVPGEPSVRYMRWLGFGGRRPVFTGLNATDLKRFAKPGLVHDPKAPPRFLYVGRYDGEKGLDVLVEAYRRYRARVKAPWTLDCVGKGPSEVHLKGVEGVNDLGFRTPKELARIYVEHDAFVLPSLYEPWGVVLAEAAGAGLPLVCTEACGARHELIRAMRFRKMKLQTGADCGNGLVVPPGDAQALADALVKIHSLNRAERQEAGEVGKKLAAPFSSEAWAERVVEMLGKLRDCSIVKL